MRTTHSIATLGAMLKSILLAATVAILPVQALAAGAPACPLVSNDVVAQAIGTQVQGGIQTDPLNPDQALDTGPNQTVCMWDADTGDMVFVTRESNVFSNGIATSPADLALKRARLPAEARAEINALREAGVSTIQVPTFAMTNAGGLGDSAVWMFQHDPGLDLASGGFVVQRGADALVFGIIGPEEGPAKTQAQALAQTVLATLAP